jgi:hypothetical protein
VARDSKELRAARRRARLSAQGQRQAEKATRRARQIQREYDERFIGGGKGVPNVSALVAAIGAKPCVDSNTGRFDGLPKYSAATVRHGVENMSEYELDLAARISSSNYRERASVKGNFNVWWYHGGKRR